MHPLTALARKTVEVYVRKGEVIRPPDTLTPEMSEKAGVFVSLKKHGQLRGCIGTFLPMHENVAQEIIRNAVAACTKDPRFNCVEEAELDSLDYSVDVLTPPEKVETLYELDPKIYGVVVTCGGRKGLLLPDLEGVDTVEDQLRIAKMKAGIFPHEHVEIFKFAVHRYR